MTRLPPGPKLKALQSLRYMRDPYAFYQSIRERYGDPVTIPTLNGTLVATGDPEGIREIFSARPDTFGHWGGDALAPLLGEQSLLCVDGTIHQSRRKLMMPAFHGERMHAYGGLFKSITRRHADAIAAGQPFLMQDLSAAITLEAIVQAIFGVLDPAASGRWAGALRDLMDRATPAAIFFRILRQELGGLSPWDKFLAARKGVDALLAAMIAERRQSSLDGDDILTLLIKAKFDDDTVMTDAELRDQLMTLLVAGHETTSSVLAWAFYWLEKHPSVRAQLVAEIAALGPDPDPLALSRLPYLDAVCNETLRLNPIVPDVARQVLKPFTLRGFDLQPGIAVAVSTTLAHTNPETFPDPLTFRPERFLERTYTPFEFMPFGGGSRRCIGAAFALYEMKTVIATLLSEYDLHLTSDREVVAGRRNLTMGPKGGVEMVLTGRRGR